MGFGGLGFRELTGLIGLKGFKRLMRFCRAYWVHDGFQGVQVFMASLGLGFRAYWASSVHEVCTL